MGAPSLPPSLGAPDAGSRFAGVTRPALVAQPAAGADWSYRVDGGTWQRIQLVRALLTTSVVVANRAPVFSISDPDGLPFWQWAPTAAQAAGAALAYSAAPLGGLADHVAGGVSDFSIPSLWLPAGWSFRVTTALLDAGDQWSAIRLVVDELDRGPYGEAIGIDQTAGF